MLISNRAASLAASVLRRVGSVGRRKLVAGRVCAGDRSGMGLAVEAPPAADGEIRKHCDGSAHTDGRSSACKAAAPPKGLDLAMRGATKNSILSVCSIKNAFLVLLYNIDSVGLKTYDAKCQSPN